MSSMQKTPATPQQVEEIRLLNDQTKERSSSLKDEFGHTALDHRLAAHDSGVPGNEIDAIEANDLINWATAWLLNNPKKES